MEAAPAAPRLLHCGGLSRLLHLRPSAVSASSPQSLSPPPRRLVPHRGPALTSHPRFGEVSKDIQRMRKQLEEDEQLASLLRGLRGQNLRDEQFADANVRMRLVEPMLVRRPKATVHQQAAGSRRALGDASNLLHDRATLANPGTPLQ
ncbi:hypothetical protein ACP70R_046096 [Stipagrostis hirtigluma subsp. patula]